MGALGIPYHFWVRIRREMINAMFGLRSNYDSVNTFISRRGLVINGGHTCPFCGKTFRRRYALKTHIQRVHHVELDDLVEKYYRLRFHSS